MIPYPDYRMEFVSFESYCFPGKWFGQFIRIIYFSVFFFSGDQSGIIIEDIAFFIDSFNDIHMFVVTADITRVEDFLQCFGIGTGDSPGLDDITVFFQMGIS